MTPALFTNSQTFYGPTVTKKVWVSLDGQPFFLFVPFGQTTDSLEWVDPQGFPAAWAQGTLQNVSPELTTNSQTFYAPTVTLGSAYTIVCASIPSQEDVGEPIISGGAHTIICAGIGSQESIGRPIIGQFRERGSVRPPDMDVDRLLARLRAQALAEDGELLLLASELVCAVD